MTTLVVHPARAPLAGSVPVPADADIAHLALVLAALASGESRIAGIAPGHPAGWTVDCLRALGVPIASDATAPGRRAADALTVHGVGLGGLRAPDGPLDAGPSAATVRLLCAVFAGQPFRAVVAGQASLSRAPLGAADLLRARGAVIEGAAGRDGGLVAPITVGPRPEARALGAVEHASAVPSAEIKTALLLSGLYADGPTLYEEPTVSADHAERLLEALGAPIHTMGPAVQLDPAGWSGALASFAMTVPGDVTAAALLVGAAQLVEGSRVTVRAVGINRTRAGWLEIARDFGAGLGVVPLGETCGEPIADLQAWSAPLVAARIGGETLGRAGPDLLVAGVLAARASGTTRVTDLADAARAAALQRLLRAFDVRCAVDGSGLAIEGRGGPLAAAELHAEGDADVAMCAGVLALAADGPSTVRGAECIQDRYPKFVATLRALGARVDVAS